MLLYSRQQVGKPFRVKQLFRQVILSASKRQNLLGQMARFDILPYFDEVLGLDHIYATSKEGIGRAWMERAGVDPADCAMIGDTLHDADVARAMGAGDSRDSAEDLAIAGIDKMAALAEKLHIPKFADIEQVDPKDFPRLAKTAANADETADNPVMMNETDFVNVMTAVYEGRISY